jgi:hypothetical protein
MSLAYPKPDRSDHQPNDRKTAENDRLDIGWADGVLSDGRPFTMELWAMDQTTFFQGFFSAIGLEELDRGQLQELLEREGLVRFVSEKRFAGGRLITDRSGNRMWEINIVVDDEDEFYAESGVSFARYPRT